MATRLPDGAQLKSFQVRAERRVMQQRYHEWSDGNVWEIVQGVDFTTSMVSCRGSLSSWASSHGYHLRSSNRFVPEGHLLIQFVPKEGTDAKK